MPAQEVHGFQNVVVVAQQSSATQRLILYRKIDLAKPSIVHLTLEDDANFSWVTKLHKTFRSSEGGNDGRIYLTSQIQNCGNLGFFKCLMKEEEEKSEPSKLTCIFDPQNTLSSNRQT